MSGDVTEVSILQTIINLDDMNEGSLSTQCWIDFVCKVKFKTPTPLPSADKTTTENGWNMYNAAFCHEICIKDILVCTMWNVKHHIK